ncbi:hypothetical protein [Brevibacillus sp. SYSU BS000544]|uniref:hypothetical protein n=1 Tax=Brevibacillus sp. SYSU BS000544 TaxID=3416443 RepID=UPI003CE4BD8F
MKWNEWVEETFEHELKKQKTVTDEEKSQIMGRISFNKKALVVMGVVSMAAVVSGCSDSEPVTATAYEECQWEDANGIEHNCDDDNDSFYSSKGYKSKKALVSTSSKYYQHKASQMSSSSSKSGIGGGGSGTFGG